MKVSKCYWVLAVLFSPIVMACQQVSATGTLHDEVRQLYNFEPHSLSDVQRSEKSKLLDQFWAKARSQREVYAPGLRQELADFTNPPFFLAQPRRLQGSIPDQRT
jgi:hypothetical protein